MRVGIYLGRFSPDTGGAFTFANAILRGLERHGIGHECLVLHGGPHEGSPPGATIPMVAYRSGFEARWLKAKHVILRSVKLTEGHYLNSVIKRHGIDFLWMLTPAFLPHLAVPYAFTVWDLAHREHPYFPEVSVEGWSWEDREETYAHMLPRASCVIIGNNTGRDLIRLFYRVPMDRVFAITMPAPDPSAVVPRAPDAKLTRPYLFYPAQFWAHKNHVNSLLALKATREKHGLELDLVFTGSDKGNLAHVRRTAEVLGLSGAVHFLGFVSDAELAHLYTNAFGLLYLSFFGPDNLPPLEAFAFGCPVIASRIPGHVEQLGTTALFADPTSPDEAATCIMRLHVEQDLRRDLIERGRTIASQRTVQTYLASMRGILEKFEPIRRTWPLASETNPVKDVGGSDGKRLHLPD